MVELTQQEADLLIAIEKSLTSPRKVKIPKIGDKNTYEILSVDEKEEFKFSAYRGGVKTPNKISYSLLYQGTTTLLRVENGHGIHINPDGYIIPAFTPHIHLYKEGYHYSFAYELPASFKNPNDMIQTLFDFLKHSNVINVNNVKICCQGGLFNE